MTSSLCFGKAEDSIEKINEMEVKWGCDRILILVLLGLILCHVEVCDGGTTSSYVRSVDFSKDMPIDADVFRLPPGYNTPQQVSFNIACFFFYFFGLVFCFLIGHL